MVESNTATTTTTTTATTIRTPFSSPSFQEGDNDNNVIDTTTTTTLPVSVDHHPTNHDNDVPDHVPDANNHHDNNNNNNNNNVNPDYYIMNVQFTDMEYAMESFYTIVQPGMLP